MYDDYLYRRRSPQNWRFVIVVGMILGAVTMLVICSRGMDPRERPAERISKQRGLAGLKEDPALNQATLEAEDALLGQVGPLATLRARPSVHSQGIWRHVQAAEAELLNLRRKLHQHPELANREARTAAILATALASLGLEVQKGVAGTGLVATVKGSRPGPVVAARAVMDGLAVAETSGLEFASAEQSRFMGRVVPVSHAAGHDVEMAILIGVAEVLADLRKDLPGTVKLIFQPAAELVPPGERDGATAMLEAGVLREPPVTALFALKVQPALPVGHVAIDTSAEGGGIVRFTVALTSPAAGCRRPGPQCPDLVAAAAQLVLALRALPHSRMDASERLLITVGSIHGGQTGETLPDRLEITGTIRWRRMGDRNLATHLIRRLVQSEAGLAGARSQVSFEHAGLLVGNNPRLAHWTLGTAVRVLERSRIHVSAVPAVTDPGFDLFRRQLPAVLLQIGVTPRGQKATRIGASEFVADDQSIALGVHLLANLLVDYLKDGTQDGPARAAPAR
jgi:amidohydrolase